MLATTRLSSRFRYRSTSEASRLDLAGISRIARRDGHSFGHSRCPPMTPPTLSADERRKAPVGRNGQEWAELDGRIEIVPTTISDAREFVAQFHRHHSPPVSGLFAVACALGEKIVGVAIIGRPVARKIQDGFTAEVTRLCTDGTKNSASMLYGAAWRAARALGYRRLITFTLSTEPGTSLRAAGWKLVGETPGRSWNVPSRPRVDRHPLQQRFRWEAA